MKMFAFKSIKTRLMFWFLFIALTPLLTALVVTYTQRVNVIEAQTFDKLIAIRDLKVYQLEHWLDERTGDLQVMSEDIEIRTLENIFEKKEKSSEDNEKLKMGRELLNRYRRNYISYSEIFIVAVNTGVIEISTNAGSLGKNKYNDLYFTVPLETGEIYIKDIYFSSTTHKPVMTISIPIFCLTHNKHIVGILVARIDLHNSLYKMLLERVGLGKTGETLIVDKNVLALNKLLWHKNASLNLQIDAEPAVNASQGKTGITITTDYRGEKILAAYTYIPKTGWGFICKQDLYELNAPIREMVLNFVVIFVISAILIYLVAFFIGNTISQPIIGMAVLTKKIKTGDYSARNVVQFQDELGSLANSINEMTDSIKSKITIEKGVNDISKIMIGQSSMEEFGSDLLKYLMKITGAEMSAFYVLNELTSEFEHFTSIGANKELLKPFNPENSEGEFGNGFLQKSIYYLRDFPEDTVFKFQTFAGDAIPEAIITIPILIEEIVVAFVSLVNIHGCSKDCYGVLEQSWLSINTSYSNLIANERTRVLAENIYKINQNLEARSKELQRQNIELEIQREKVEETNKELESFSYSVSHDLRVPLRHIDGFVRLLLKREQERMDTTSSRYLETISESSNRMGLLIDDLLSFSRTGRTKMQLQSVDSNKVVREALKELSLLTEGRYITWEVDDLPAGEADSSLLRLVWENLIGNAIKYTGLCEEASIEIGTIYGGEMADEVVFFIRDNGIGFDPQYAHKLFGVFQRLHSNNEFEGTGIGLATVQRIVHRHGGRVWAEGEVNHGATFYFTLKKG